MDERRLNFSEIIEILKLNKKLIYRNSLIFFFLSIVISCSIPDRYTSHAVLASSEVEGSNLSKSSLPTSGLGIISMNSISPRMQQALEIMESWEFIENFISENKLEVYIYAVEGWDEDTHQLEINSDLYHLGESTTPQTTLRPLPTSSFSKNQGEKVFTTQQYVKTYSRLHVCAITSFLWNMANHCLLTF